MKLVLVSLLTSLALFTSCMADDCGQFYKAFQWHGLEYEVRFIENTNNSIAWPVDLVMRWKLPEKNDWHVAGRIDGVRLEKKVKLADKSGHNIDALVLSSPVGSAQWISVAEISQNPPKLNTLLGNVLDKGGIQYRYDSAGILIGLKFKYLAWHVSPDNLKGHAFTAMNVGWHPVERKFKEGAVYVDDEAEQKASLADILDSIGAKELLDVEVISSNDDTTCACIYKPFGILYQKTPPELRSAKKVKAVLKHDSAGNPYIADIEAVENE